MTQHLPENAEGIHGDGPRLVLLCSGSQNEITFEVEIYERKIPDASAELTLTLTESGPAAAAPVSEGAQLNGTAGIGLPYEYVTDHYHLVIDERYRSSVAIPAQLSSENRQWNGYPSVVLECAQH